MAAVAGVITHVPAGLGVLEAVFVTMLSSRLPAAQLLAGLLAYRAVYYLLPLAVAAALFAHVEWRRERSFKNGYPAFLPSRKKVRRSLV